MPPSTRDEAVDELESCQCLRYIDKAALLQFLHEEDDATVYYRKGTQSPRLSRTLYLKIERSKGGEPSPLWQNCNALQMHVMTLAAILAGGGQCKLAIIQLDAKRTVHWCRPNRG